MHKLANREYNPKCYDLQFADGKLAAESKTERNFDLRTITWGSGFHYSYEALCWYEGYDSVKVD